MATNLLSNAGDISSIPGQETKIPHATGHLSLLAAANPVCHKYWACALWSLTVTASEKPARHKKGSAYGD